MIKEIVFYNFFNNVEIVLIFILGTMSYLYVSIDRLIEDFVSGFQVDFLFIVSIIFRIGDKLFVKDVFDDVVVCVFCGVLMSVDLIFLFIFIDSVSFVKFNIDDENIFQFVSSSGCCGGCSSGCSILFFE